MTVLQLKRSMDARFRRVDRRFVRLERTLRAEIRSSEERLESRMREGEERLESRMRESEERWESRIRESEERLRRHFDVVVESLHDDLRIFAEAIGSHSDRLGDHETRVRRLEQR